MTLRQLLLALTFMATPAVLQAQTDPVDFVDPFIGTTNFSVCNPGAVLPHGLMSAVPFNVMGSDENVYDKDQRWWSAPYVKENTFFTGLAHVTLSGVGCPEMGTLLLMPTAGQLDVDPRNYGSTYKDEKATPGYYSLYLNKYNIKCEATTTLRTSIERFTFRKGQANILLNIGDGLTNETGGSIRRVSDTEIEGMRLLGTFCYNRDAVFPIYFVMRISKPAKQQGFWKKQPPMQGVEAQWDQDNGKYKVYNNYQRELAGNELGYFYTFDADEGEQIEVQIGVSFVSTANARENLKAEQRGFEFDKVRTSARQQWAETLNRITVEGGTLQQKRIFYTALYHTQIHPTILQDVNGEYPQMENGRIGKIQTGNRYTVFSLWDTYRNLHQLETLLYPEQQEDMVRSMIDMYKEWGWMPKWELFGRETWTMEGDPAIIVIADTYQKGLRNFDISTAYEAFRKSATMQGSHNLMRPDIDPYLEKGYIPLGLYAADNSGDNSVSHALEYYVADAALSQLAKTLGKHADAERFRRQSLGYKHYYSRESGTLRPLNADGTFLTPFNPADGADFSNAPGFHEGSAWNYTFAVPHDVEGLARIMGGKRQFVEKLQNVFDKNLYDPANEPDIAYAYLFSYFNDEAWRTQKEVKRLLDTYYKDTPDGIPGNEDCGTMSAWAVFSMMGFYPDNPASQSYTLTTPTFSKIILHLDKRYYPQGDLTIECLKPNNSAWAIKRATLGGKTLNTFRVNHRQLVDARNLIFQLKP